MNVPQLLVICGNPDCPGPCLGPTNSAFSDKSEDTR